MLSINQCATLACLLDVTATKPGNVHRGADFADMSFLDFVKSAVAIGPVFERVREQSVGLTILESITSTRKVTSANTNLGIVLLLAPLAKAVSLGGGDGSDSVASVLNDLTPRDAADAFDAIRLANPGGLGEVDEMDVNRDPAPGNLLAAMELAADRDQIARQYVSEFELVYGVKRQLLDFLSHHELTHAIVLTHVQLLAQVPDSLIVRKCGSAVGQEASTRAQAALDAGGPESPDFLDAAGDLDFWLRSDGNRRNPGTTADIVTAAVFLALAEGAVVLSPDLHLR